jgi:tetratricopeptide (TPR) repeat protein
MLQAHLTDTSVEVREVAEAGLWELWGRSGDDRIDALLARGVEEMRGGDLDAAIATFSSIIDRRPDFAEGWNKRATALFLAGELRRSLADCNEVIKRNPAHFGALAGFGQIYFQLEQYERAIAFWQRALQVNPNMTGVAISIKATEHLIAQQRRRSA